MNTTTRVASGKPAIVGSQASGAGKEAIHTYFVLTATVPEDAKAAAAAPPPVKFQIFALSHARAADLVKALRPILEGQRITLAADERVEFVDRARIRGSARHNAGFDHPAG